MAGSLDKKFQDKVVSLTDHAKETAQGMLNLGQVAWDTLDDKGPDEPGPERFLRTFHEDYDRERLAKQYIELNSKTSSSPKDVKSKLSQVKFCRMQHDYLMAMERDFLMRRRSRVRIEGHAAAVRDMLSDNAGPFQMGPLRLAKQLLAQSGEDEE